MKCNCTISWPSSQHQLCSLKKPVLETVYAKTKKNYITDLVGYVKFNKILPKPENDKIKYHVWQTKIE